MIILVIDISELQIIITNLEEDMKEYRMKIYLGKQTL